MYGMNGREGEKKCRGKEMKKRKKKKNGRSIGEEDDKRRPSQDHPALHSSFVREFPFIISKAVIRFIEAAFKR